MINNVFLILIIATKNENCIKHAGMCRIHIACGEQQKQRTIYGLLVFAITDSRYIWFLVAAVSNNYKFNTCKLLKDGKDGQIVKLVI